MAQARKPSLDATLRGLLLGSWHKTMIAMIARIVASDRVIDKHRQGDTPSVATDIEGIPPTTYDPRVVPSTKEGRYKEGSDCWSPDRGGAVARNSTGEAQASPRFRAADREESRP